MARLRVSVSAALAAPPETAWAVLVRWEGQARWMRDVDTVRVLTPHREGLGVRVAARTRVLGVPFFTDVLEVAVWEPPRLLRMQHRGLVRGTGEWLLEPLPDGSRFTWTEQVSLAIPLLGELALLAYRPIMRRLMRGGLARLQALVRSEAA